MSETTTILLAADDYRPGEPWWTGEPVARLERSVLGSILTLGHLLPDVRAVVTASDFEALGHQKIFEAMEAVSREGVEPDLVLVGHELAKAGYFNAAYLSSLVDRIPAVESAVHYARRMKECAAVRRQKQLQQRERKRK